MCGGLQRPQVLPVLRPRRCYHWFGGCIAIVASTVGRQLAQMYPGAAPCKQLVNACRWCVYTTRVEAFQGRAVHAGGEPSGLRVCVAWWHGMLTCMHVDGRKLLLPSQPMYHPV